jgi:formate dehydrogenase iron-sulfur subunit
MAKAFFIDLSRCTGCRGCQVACKQWKNLPAEPTKNTGSHTNPPDLSSKTYKTVHMLEHGKAEKLQLLYFPEQCRHCYLSPCMTASDVAGAIIEDPDTGAVVFTELTAKIKDKQGVRKACPYDIPRIDEATGIIHKCDFCNDRVRQGMLPACVLSCPTGAMNFGEESAMLAMAEARLAELKKTHPDAQLGDAGTVRVLYLYHEKPELFHKYAVFAQTLAAHTSRRALFAKLAPRLKSNLG